MCFQRWWARFSHLFFYLQFLDLEYDSRFCFATSLVSSRFINLPITILAHFVLSSDLYMDVFIWFRSLRFGVYVMVVWLRFGVYVIDNFSVKFTVFAIAWIEIRRNLLFNLGLLLVEHFFKCYLSIWGMLGCLIKSIFRVLKSTFLSLMFFFNFCSALTDLYHFVFNRWMSFLLLFIHFHVIHNLLVDVYAMHNLIIHHNVYTMHHTL